MMVLRKFLFQCGMDYIFLLSVLRGAVLNLLCYTLLNCVLDDGLPGTDDWSVMAVRRPMRVAVSEEPRWCNCNCGECMCSLGCRYVIIICHGSVGEMQVKIRSG